MSELPVKEISHLIDIINKHGFKVEGIIVDDLPKLNGGDINQFCSRYGLIEFYTKNGIKRKILNQMESHLRESIQF